MNIISEASSVNIALVSESTASMVFMAFVEASSSTVSQRPVIKKTEAFNWKAATAGQHILDYENLVNYLSSALAHN